MDSDWKAPMPKRFPALFWLLLAAQFVVFTILLTLGMRTIANYFLLASFCESLFRAGAPLQCWQRTATAHRNVGNSQPNSKGPKKSQSLGFSFGC